MPQTQSRDSTISCPDNLMRITEGKRVGEMGFCIRDLLRDKDSTDVRIHEGFMCVP